MFKSRLEVGYVGISAMLVMLVMLVMLAMSAMSAMSAMQPRWPCRLLGKLKLAEIPAIVQDFFGQFPHGLRILRLCRILTEICIVRCIRVENDVLMYVFDLKR